MTVTHHCLGWQWGNWILSQQECNHWSQRSCWRCRWWGWCPSQWQTAPCLVGLVSGSYLWGEKHVFGNEDEDSLHWLMWSQATSKHTTGDSGLAWSCNMLGIPDLNSYCWKKLHEWFMYECALLHSRHFWDSRMKGLYTMTTCTTMTRRIKA